MYVTIMLLVVQSIVTSDFHIPMTPQYFCKSILYMMCLIRYIKENIVAFLMESGSMQQW